MAELTRKAESWRLCLTFLRSVDEFSRLFFIAR